MDTPTPGAGRRYWRSLEERLDTPEFRERLRRAFPEQQAALLDPVTRRGFLALLGASLGLAGLSGCQTQAPPEKIVPYVRQPEGLVPGKPLYFATAMPLAGEAAGLLVESHEGRPTKVEGNPDHPASGGGATDIFAQASVLSLYDPDRSQSVLYHGRIRAWSEGRADLRDRLRELAEKQGEGLWILTEAVASPTLAWQLDRLLSEKKSGEAETDDKALRGLTEARWVEYEPACLGAGREGARMAFGEPLDVRYAFTEKEDPKAEEKVKADVVLSLDADFLSCGGGRLSYTRGFTVGRRAESAMNRLYAVESTPTNTGMVADHRLALRPGQVERFARALAAKLGVAGVQAPELDKKGTHWVDILSEDLRLLPPEEGEARRERRPDGTTLVVAGDGQPAAVHALAYAINVALGNVGATVFFSPPPQTRAERGLAALKALADALEANEVKLLLVLGGNPAYTAPADLKLAERIKKADVSVHLGAYADETAAACDWHIPEAHYLESWGDARAFDGTASVIQPLIAPLYRDALSAHELLSGLVEGSRRTGHDLVRQYWRERHGKEATDGAFEKFWNRALHDGIIPGTQAATKSPHLQEGWAKKAWPDGGASTPSAPKEGEYEAVFRLDPTVFDGRFANNGWLQELPKPLTKLTWDNAVLVGPKTAADLGVKPAAEGSRGGQHGEMITDVVELTFADGRSVKAPVWITPGCTEGVLTLHLGNGRERAGKVGDGAGFNAYKVWTSAAPLFEGGVRVGKPVKRFTLACVQGFHTMDVSGIPTNKIDSALAPIRSGTKKEFDENPLFLAEGKYEQEYGLLPEDDDGRAPEGAGQPPRRELPLIPRRDYSQGEQWGMSIDVGACVGCGACVVACQAENNIPVVGKEEVTHGRVMHWLRVDRYFEGKDDDPTRVYFQPVPCMHCENAPCEQVCPVAATVHSPDGLNEMVYNRCVGTRYCSNNCPYKVRRFNFLHYADFHTPSLKLLNNPDVTVRSRGVMEKCTFCVQRIREAEITAANQGRKIREGDVLTACQAACPAQAIVFGDINDPKSRVMAKKQSPLNYGLLVDLNTRPRVTYLAALRNPNPALEPKGS
jgi:molybdopterin-containing oxidoreductase family iron-sulfur binding subunit